VLSPLDITGTTAEAAASVDTFAFDASKQLLDLDWILMIFRSAMKIVLRAKLHMAGEQTIDGKRGAILNRAYNIRSKYLEGRIINKRLSHQLRTRARGRYRGGN
jgi:hypothetical protein